MLLLWLFDNLFWARGLNINDWTLLCISYWDARRREKRESQKMVDWIKYKKLILELALSFDELPSLTTFSSNSIPAVDLSMHYSGCCTVMCQYFVAISSARRPHFDLLSKGKKNWWAWIMEEVTQRNRIEWIILPLDSRVVTLLSALAFLVISFVYPVVSNPANVVLVSSLFRLKDTEREEKQGRDIMKFSKLSRLFFWIFKLCVK